MTKLKMTRRITDSFESLDKDMLLALSEAKVVETKANGRTRTQVVTKSPYFVVDHLALLGEKHIDIADGVWWMDLDGRSKSLRNMNVIPNTYNDHSLTILS